MTEHKHAFRMTMHLDGCHFYRSVYACRCGATAATYDERDPSEDPYSLIWMEPTQEEVRRDERGRFCKPFTREVRCDRCEELIADAEARHEQEIFEKGAA